MSFRLYALVTVAVLATACSQSPPEQKKQAPAEIAAQRRKAAQEFRLEYSQPAAVDSLSTYQYQYIGLTGKDERASEYSGSGYDKSDYESSLNFNLAFFHPDGSDAHLLLPHSRFRMLDFDTGLQPAARAPYLFYTIITTDLNRDGRQNAADPSQLFVSDRQGRHLRPVTPDSADVIHWQVTAPHFLIVQLRTDSDHNGSYSHLDATQWLRYDLRNLTAPPSTLLPSSMGQTLRSQLIYRRLQLPNEE